MQTIEEAQKEARNKAILEAKKKLESDGLVISAEEYNALGATYKLYVASLALKLNHNTLKMALNDMNVQL